MKSNPTVDKPAQPQQSSLDRAFISRFSKHMFFAILGIFVLSYITTRAFTHIDYNLFGYMVGTIVFLGGYFYRWVLWTERPPTKVFLKKGLKLIFRRSTVPTATDHLVAYKFIWNRGIYRWLQHVLIGWGVILSCLVTFPLVFGWMYFTMSENGIYTIIAFGLNIISVDADGWLAFLFYNALNITAFMVIAGVCMVIYRRIKNMQARAEQSVIYDFMPLYMLLFVSVTGLLLTFSNIALHGFMHPILSLIHQFSVIITMIYLPFGKLAHIQIRPLSVLAKNYRAHYAEQEMKPCKACGEQFVSAEQSSDVIDVLKQNDMEFAMKEGFHLAELCVSCRRKYRIAQISGVQTHLVKVKEANQNAKG
jgi:hypothetical protein